jgi:hypothetical protein
MIYIVHDAEDTEIWGIISDSYDLMQRPEFRYVSLVLCGKCIDQ